MPQEWQLQPVLPGGLVGEQAQKHTRLAHEGPQGRAFEAALKKRQPDRPRNPCRRRFKDGWRKPR